MKFIVVPFNSTLYNKTVQLRYEILRKPLNLQFSKEQLEKEIDDFHCTIIDNNEVIACLVLSPVDKQTVKMRQVAVSTGNQEKGVGKKLINHAEEFARNQGFREIIANARETVVTFYEKCGYSTTGDPFEEIGIPHQAVKKML